MATAPTQELTSTLSNDRLPIENSGVEPAAFVLHIGSEMIRQGQPRAKVELTRRLYQRLASEKGLREIRKQLLVRRELRHVTNELRITAKKQLNPRGDFCYFLCFALDPA